MKTLSQVTVSTIEEVTVLHLPADILDSLETALARKQWQGIIATQKPRKVVVSFDAVRSCGSEAVGGLIHLADSVRSYGGDVKLCSMSTRIREIFDICKLMPTVFVLYHSVAEAVDAFE
jgi:anti-anti-sigma factor